MDRRCEQRIRTDQPAKVTLLDPSGAEFPARILDLSGRGMRLLAGRSLLCGSALKVEAGDALLLGEVCYSVLSDSGFEIGLELQHSLIGLQELTRRNASILLEDEIATGRS